MRNYAFFSRFTFAPALSAPPQFSSDPLLGSSAMGRGFLTEEGVER